MDTPCWACPTWQCHLGINKVNGNSPQQLLLTSGLCQAGPRSRDTQEPQHKNGSSEGGVTSQGHLAKTSAGPGLSLEECDSGLGEVGLDMDPSVGA